MYAENDTHDPYIVVYCYVSAADEVPVKFLSYWKTLNMNLVVSGLAVRRPPLNEYRSPWLTQSP